MKYEGFKPAILGALNEGRARGRRAPGTPPLAALTSKDQAGAWQLLCQVMDRLSEDKTNAAATKRIGRLSKEIAWLCEVIPEARPVMREFATATAMDITFLLDRFGTSDFIRRLAPVYSLWTGAEVAFSKDKDKVTGPFVRFVCAVMKACGERAKPDGIAKAITKYKFLPSPAITAAERFGPAIKRLLADGELLAPPSGSKPKPQPLPR